MALLWKMICNLGDPMSLRHPVDCFVTRTTLYCNTYYPTLQRMLHCIATNATLLYDTYYSTLQHILQCIATHTAAHCKHTLHCIAALHWHILHYFATHTTAHCKHILHYIATRTALLWHILHYSCNLLQQYYITAPHRARYCVRRHQYPTSDTTFKCILLYTYIEESWENFHNEIHGTFDDKIYGSVYTGSTM